MNYEGRLIYFWPQFLSWFGGADLIGGLIEGLPAPFIIGAVCTAVAIWITRDNYKTHGIP